MRLFISFSFLESYIHIDIYHQHIDITILTMIFQVLRQISAKLFTLT